MQSTGRKVRADRQAAGRRLQVVDSVKDDWEATDLIDQSITGGTLEHLVELYRQRIRYLDGRSHYEILSASAVNRWEPR